MPELMNRFRAGSRLRCIACVAGALVLVRSVEGGGIIEEVECSGCTEGVAEATTEAHAYRLALHLHKEFGQDNADEMSAEFNHMDLQLEIHQPFP